MEKLPAVSHIYKCHHLDSTKWNHFRPREDDIVIASAYKAGTTWVQAIVGHLLYPDGNFPGPLSELSPWLEAQFLPLKKTLKNLDNQRGRRFIKSHLGLHALPYNKNIKYIYIARDGRDVFMSLWNHYNNMTDDSISLINAIIDSGQPKFPYPPISIKAFWHSWLNRGLFKWENNGWPYWSYFSNIESWWRYRNLENILYVHFNDLLSDPMGEIRRVAEFLDIRVSDLQLAKIVDAVTFTKMKNEGEMYAPNGGKFLKNGANSFFHRGTSGQWKGVLSDSDLSKYELLARSLLSGDCRRWLEYGGVVPLHGR